MVTYKRLTPPLVSLGGAAAKTVLAVLMSARLRNKEQGRQKATLAGWGDEGDSLVAPAKR
jgi:hypothetical protein